MPAAATVTDCLERARECAALAENMTDDDKIKMLAVAEAWLKVADEIAKETTRAMGSLRTVTANPRSVRAPRNLQCHASGY
jgi:hypothetical protein